jgi:uncharacterized protein with ParB-like and HNH nuclease domain
MQYRIQKLDQIFSDILSRKLVLPDFQRDFVWKREQQAKLIASMLNDLPSGSFLTSKMPQPLSCRDCGLKNDYFFSDQDNKFRTMSFLDWLYFYHNFCTTFSTSYDKLRNNCIYNIKDR